MFIVNGSPIDMEIYQWVAENKHLVFTPMQPRERLVVFRQVAFDIQLSDQKRLDEIEASLPSFEMETYNPRIHPDFDIWEKSELERIKQLKEKYKDTITLIDRLKEREEGLEFKKTLEVKLSDLNVNQLLKLLDEIILMALGLHKKYAVDYQLHTIQDIESELETIQDYILSLLNQENLNKNLFIDLEPSFYDAEDNYLNLKAVFHFYFKLKLISNQLKKLKELETDLFRAKFPEMTPYKKDQLRQYLVDKIAKEEEKNDFLISTILQVMETVSCEELAMLNIEKTTKNFKHSPNAQEQWRSQFGSYFDEERKTFKTFLDGFPNLCFWFFTRFYYHIKLSTTFLPIPFFKLYMSLDKKRISYEIIDFFDIRKFEKAEDELYGHF